MITVTHQKSMFQSMWSHAWTQLKKDRLGMLGLIVIIIYLIIAIGVWLGIWGNG